MRKRFEVLIAAGILLCSRGAFAHRIDEYLQATLLTIGTNHVQASMRLIPGVLVAPSVIAGIDLNRDGGFSESEEEAYARRVLGDLSITSDGRNVTPVLSSWSFPDPAQMREGLGEIHIDYTIASQPGGVSSGSNRTLIITNHHLNQRSVYLMNVLAPQDAGTRILTQKRNEQQSVYELEYQQTAAAFEGSPMSTPISMSVAAWLKGVQFPGLFRLGMRHIAEGTDHLLFLLVLLLPAPLVSSRLRWGPPASVRASLLRILGIVTAFTIGHSITLSVAALNLVSVASRPVEVLVAVSILVSAVHAWRPIFPGRETWIAASFGLIHGLAFAATLNRLALDRWDRVAGILAFNLGIESMQILIVAGILPSLLLLSRTRLYPILRTGGAALAGVASAGWIAERLFDLATPVDAVVNALARHALLIAVSLLLVSFACRRLSTQTTHTA